MSGPRIPYRRRGGFLIFGQPLIGNAEIAEVVDSLRTAWPGTGPKVARFESDFAHYKGVTCESTTALNSGTAALHLSLLAAGIGAGDEVITTPLTFCATANAIIHSGATPILADIDPVTMNISPEEVERHVTDRTRAILPVHFAGRPCDMDALQDIAQRHSLVVIEDCAHAVEAEYHGRKAGTIGDFGCFSFYANKNLTTGEGGIAVARAPLAAGAIRTKALHGLSNDAWHRFSDTGYKQYDVIDLGFKYNMMDLQAAIGIHQLARIETFWRRRLEIWRQYQDAFETSPLLCPAEPAPNTRHAFHLYTLRIDPDKCAIDRDRFVVRMTEENIGVGIHYLSLPEHSYYQSAYGWRPERYPQAMKVGRETVSLPLSPRLGDKDVADVIAAVFRVLKHPESAGAPL